MAVIIIVPSSAGRVVFWQMILAVRKPYIDYTFVLVNVDNVQTDYSGICGNMASVLGPLAVEEGMISTQGDRAQVRVCNTNTAKYYDCCFKVREGLPVERGDFEIPGVTGTGASIELKFGWFDNRPSITVGQSARCVRYRWLG